MEYWLLIYYIRASILWMFVKRSEAAREFSNVRSVQQYRRRSDVTKLVSTLEQATTNIFRDAGTLKDYNSNRSVYKPRVYTTLFRYH